MSRKKRRKLWKALGWTGLALLTLFLLTPYLFPLSAPAAAREGAPFENSAFHTVDGASFHYRVYPPPEKQPEAKLLLVHGLAGSTFSFEALAPLLSAQGYLVVSVDLPGFGYSDRSPDYNHSQANRGRDLWQLLHAVDQGLPASAAAMPWHLGGHSMGGGTVTAMALQRPTRTLSLVLLDPALSGDARGGLWLRLPVLSRWLAVALEHYFFNEATITSLLTSAYGAPPTQAQVAGYLTPLRLPGTAAALAGMMRTARQEAPLRPEDVGAPVLAIWGEQDTWVPVSELEKLQAALPDTAAHIIPGAGHCPMETHTREVAALLLTWLPSHRP